MSDTVDSEEVRAWRVAQRLTELRGEERANLIRIVGIAGFYGVQLLNRYGVALGPVQIPAMEGVEGSFHLLMSLLALTGVLVASGVLIALRNRFFPWWIKYATSTVDLVLASIALVVADGPSSPLVVIFFPLLGLSVLRFSQSLVRYTTCATIVAYLFVALAALRDRPTLAVPLYQAILFVLALAIVGVALDHVAREVRRLAGAYADRASRVPAAPSADAEGGT
ncbi:MAG: hypothetical protein K1X94_18600 [Sandaracinaceae bacterium]|nr:hypothetical protein [Sandaracinaceae bacterium]